MSDDAAVGFIGLGVMGEAMCGHLVHSGLTVFAFDLDPEPLDRIAALGGKACASADELSRKCNRIITCLPGGAQVAALLGGSDGMIARARDGQIFVEMSTSPPDLMRRLNTEAAQRGAALVDAPIARTRQAAAEGTLAIMVGAPDVEAFETVRPLLEVMGSDVMHCGGTGAGQAAKILNNMVLFQNVVAIAEAVSIAEGNGFDPRKMVEAMMLGSADSFALRNHGVKWILPKQYPDRKSVV